MCLNNYHAIYQIVHRHCNLNIIFFINKHVINFFLYVENGAQFLNATTVSLSTVTVISPVTKINASE